MRSSYFCALAVFGMATLGQAAVAQSQAPAKSASTQSASTQSASTQSADAQSAAPEAPESVFDGKVRRYRFDLEGMLVTADTAEEFVVSYRGNRERPRIFGAYADDECNALVVVASPESEQAIRETLAEWIVARGGIETPSLKVQRRALEFRWREILTAMADVEVELVKLTPDRAELHRDRLRAFEAELTTAEKQLQVIDRYLARLAAGPSSGQ